MKTKFREHLKKCSKEVEKYPKFKKDCVPSKLPEHNEKTEGQKLVEILDRMMGQ